MDSELQVENGNYTRIVNPLIENLIKMPFKGCELAVALFIIRKTYGYQKKEDKISLSQIQKGINRSRMSVVKAMKNLELTNIVVNTRIPYQENKLRINKYFDTWKVVNTVRLVSRKNKLVNTGIPKLVNTGIHTKEKRNIQKKVAVQSTAEDISFIIGLFKEVNPTHERLFGMPPQRTAVDRLLVKFGKDKLEAMVRFLPKSNASRYAPTITTPVQLERDLGKLVAWGQKEKDIKKTNVAFV